MKAHVTSKQLFKTMKNANVISASYVVDVRKKQDPEAQCQ